MGSVSCSQDLGNWYISAHWEMYLFFPVYVCWVQMVYPLSFVATSPHHHFHLSVIHANGTSKQCILSKKMFVFHISVHYLLCFAPPSRISLAWLFIITAHILACIFNVHVELDLPEDCHTYDWHVCVKISLSKWFPLSLLPQWCGSIQVFFLFQDTLQSAVWWCSFSSWCKPRWTWYVNREWVSTTATAHV